MTLPEVNVKFDDFQLGLVPPVADAHAKLGVAAAGPYTPQSLTRGTQIPPLYQGGPLAGAAAVALLESAPVVCVRVATTTDGAAGSVTRSGTTAGTATITVTGTPNDAYDVSLRVTRGGTTAAGDAAVIVTVNGQDGPERAVPVGGAVTVPDTGVSVQFGAGTILKGNVAAFSTTAPAATVADIAAALEGLLATRPALRFVHILGAATPALVAAVDAILTERETRSYYVHAILEARPMADGESMSDYRAAIDTQFAGRVAMRVAIALEGGEIYNPLTRRLEMRSAAWKASGRRAASPIGDAAYRVRSGALSAMGDLTFDANLTGDAGRYVTLRTFDAREGVYLASWPMLAPTGSDYDEVQRREVIDRAAQIGAAAAMDYLGEDLTVDTTTGFLLESEALGMEAFIVGRITAGIGDNASGARVRVDREKNILSTQDLDFTLSVIPKGYAKRVNVRVGFLNPALAAATPAAPVTAPAVTGGS